MSGNPHYLAYDLRGAQKFIFQIPLLQAIVGGSGLLVAFDNYAHELATGNGTRLVFAGAGHGLFVLDAAQADALVQQLLRRAHDDGMDIRIGVGSTSDEAQRNFKEHPYLPSPDDMNGPPCFLSGLYPYDPTSAGSFRDHRRQVNARVYRRIRDRNNRKPADIIDERVGAATAEVGIPAALNGPKLTFMRNVTPDKNDEPDLVAEAILGKVALGTNRWAVICMDGNGVGDQFRALSEREGPAEALETRQLMSEELGRLGLRALATGVAKCLHTWTSDEAYRKQVEGSNGQVGGEWIQVVPFRPLILGGDDIAILCHSALAFTFVRAVCDNFHAESENANRAYRTRTGRDLWPASGGSLTISAGVAFTSVSFPLHLSFPFAEQLLENAKRKGRELHAQEVLKNRGDPPWPPPACLDWEGVTEGLVEGLHTRRLKEYKFLDGDQLVDGKPAAVELTARPYRLDEFESRILPLIENTLRQAPRGVLSGVFPGLHAGYWDRQAFRLRLRKHQRALAEALEEDRGGATEAANWLHVLDAIDVCRETVRAERGRS